jgi:hypothetical protein
MAACSAGSVSAHSRCVTPSSVTVHASGVRSSAVRSTSRDVALTAPAGAPDGPSAPPAAAEPERSGGAPVPAGPGPGPGTPVVDEQDRLEVAVYRRHQLATAGHRARHHVLVRVDRGGADPHQPDQAALDEPGPRCS